MNMEKPGQGIKIFPEFAIWKQKGSARVSASFLLIFAWNFDKKTTFEQDWNTEIKPKYQLNINGLTWCDSY
jgi:hypothetical protein